MTIQQVGINDILNRLLAPIQRQGNICFGYLVYLVCIYNINPFLVSQETVGRLPIVKHSHRLISVLIHFEKHFLYTFLNSLTFV